MGLLRPLPSAGDVLWSHGPALPQPDQLCGPFSAWAALHAVLDATQVPSVTDLAVAAGTRVWPYDVAQWRPAGAPFDTTGWSALPVAATIDASGTDAAGLAAGVEALTDVVVVPATGGDVGALLASIAAGELGVGVVANIRTGPLLADPDGWDVGHFVVVHSIGEDTAGGQTVGIADTYRELGAPGEPPGCRVVGLDALVAGLTAPPGRGLLLLTRPADAAAVRRLVAAASASATPWST